MAEQQAPVVFLFFNRHEVALRVFQRIRAARPAKLVLVSDGPRADVPGEQERVEKLRRSIENLIDWPVAVDCDYAPANMGCGPRLATGIGNALAKHGRAIMIEDDCLPSPTFFPYAQELLERYKDEPRVCSISGVNFQGRRRSPCSYGFTHFPQVWGWAAWARSWEGYDRELTGWDDGFLHDLARSGTVPCFDLPAWLKDFEDIKKNPHGTWDVQFWMLCFKKRALTAFPFQNQVTNLGYGPDATHTTCWWYSNKPHFALDLPLRHPPDLTVDKTYERHLQQGFYGTHITYRNFFNNALLSMKIRLKKLRARLAR